MYNFIKKYPELINDLTVIPYKFYVTNYYKNKDQRNKDIKIIQDLTDAAYNYALLGKLYQDYQYSDISKIILKGIGIYNVGCDNKEAKINLTAKGNNFINAAILLEKQNIRVNEFKNWCQKYFLNDVDEIFKSHKNNLGAWGLYSKMLTYYYFGEINKINSLVSDFYDFAENDKKTLLFIKLANNGEFWRENLRNSSGLWYNCFRVCALLKCATILKEINKNDQYFYILKPVIDSLYKYLSDILFNNKNSWSEQGIIYRKWNIIGLRQLQNLLWPSNDGNKYNPIQSDDDIDIVWGWQYNLMQVCSKIYNDDKYLNIVDKLTNDWYYHYPNSNCFKYSKLICEENLLFEIGIS